MIHICLFLLIVAAGFFDAAMDANSHLRIHLAKMPLRDCWHLQKHLLRACLIGIGLVYPMAHYDDRWAALIALASGLIVGRAVWDATYKQPEFWLALDERLHIGTGIKWLDRFLGLHW